MLNHKIHEKFIKFLHNEHAYLRNIYDTFMIFMIYYNICIS